ncbi:hypothetical protein PA0759 [Candidatus Phytoplasma australiense]|uniref:Uncharacterized protein n=1 Tax=Phytoplasma australiense TaxID=59748 RepID=B1VAX0_PHYAS|nr:hypothetical protein PA0759 [Candidatus Phytoplasma australiense]
MCFISSFNVFENVSFDLRLKNFNASIKAKLEKLEKNYQNEKKIIFISFQKKFI